MDRRDFLRLTGYSAAVFVVLGSGKLVRAATPVRPPGAINESDFLAACSRCSKCIEVCPVDSLRLATLAEGIPAIGTPVLVQECILCMDCIEVCTHGALQPVGRTEARMGCVVVDAGICTGCGDCIPPCRFDAILQAEEGQVIQVDAEKCNGCAACISACPEPGALRLTAEGAVRP